MSATIGGQTAQAAGPRWKYQRQECRIEHRTRQIRLGAEFFR